MKYSKIYIAIMVTVFTAIVVIFTMLPRSTFSELERRELAEFPAYSFDGLKDGSWTQAISEWFSDTEPYRDHIMSMSMTIKGNMGINPLFSDPEDALAFHAPEPQGFDEVDAQADDVYTNDSIAPYEGNIAEENARLANSGILVAGTAPNARAMMAYGGSRSAGTGYAQVVNKYKQTFSDINVYCMAIPNSTEFYCPDKAKNVTNSQIATINNIYQHLTDGVKAVDCYTPLSQHVDEDIYLRTDHHWAPRGAYYAAEAFAAVAGVPFKDLSTYDEHVVRNFVGTMYGYSKDIAVKQSPEDFVYYTPNGVDYTTTYIVYDVDKGLNVRGERRPYSDKFFFHFKDGSGGAYSTFMGGDMKITQVKTSTKNGRRLVIFKDSYGNALPGYLFHSFEEVHVIDFRYFTRNFVNYAREHNITDILFAHNIFNCVGRKVVSSYNRFLTQANGSYYKPAPQDDTSKKVSTSEESPATPDTTASEQRDVVPTPAAEPEKKEENLTPVAEPEKKEETPTPVAEPTSEPEKKEDTPTPVSTPVEEPVEV